MNASSTYAQAPPPLIGSLATAGEIGARICEQIMLGIGFVLTVGTGFYVAFEFALVNRYASMEWISDCHTIGPIKG